LRALAEQKSTDITPDLLQLADEISSQATELKRALIEEGLIS
jgi:hypothetical protein